MQEAIEHVITLPRTDIRQKSDRYLYRNERHQRGIHARLFGTLMILWSCDPEKHSQSSGRRRTRGATTTIFTERRSSFMHPTPETRVQTVLLRAFRRSAIKERKRESSWSIFPAGSRVISRSHVTLSSMRLCLGMLQFDELSILLTAPHKITCSNDDSDMVMVVNHANRSQKSAVFFLIYLM